MTSPGYCTNRVFTMPNKTEKETLLAEYRVPSYLTGWCPTLAAAVRLNYSRTNSVPSSFVTSRGPHLTGLTKIRNITMT